MTGQIPGGPMFGPYRLDELLGRGGMGEVHRAYHTEQDRTVALKLLLGGLAADEEFRRRFLRESQVTAKLTDPHVIPIHNWGEIDGRLYLDMRYVQGRDLAAVLRREGPLAPHRAVTIVAQVARALDAAHRNGLVHRDVKPSNVLLAEVGDGEDDFAYLVDFGIARSLAGDSGAGLTRTGTAIGTLDYMAPERFLDEPVDGRADVYALGCLLYEALTGERPFPGEGLPAQMSAHLSTPPPRPSDRVAVPAGLDDVVARGMAKRPADRYATAGALAAAARATLTGPVATGDTGHRTGPVEARTARTALPAPPETRAGPPGTGPGSPGRTGAGDRAAGTGAGQVSGYPGGGSGTHGGHPGGASGAYAAGHPGGPSGAYAGHPGGPSGPYAGHPGGPFGPYAGAAGHPGAAPGHGAGFGGPGLPGASGPQGLLGAPPPRRRPRRALLVAAGAVVGALVVGAAVVVATSGDGNGGGGTTTTAPTTSPGGPTTPERELLAVLPIGFGAANCTPAPALEDAQVDAAVECATGPEGGPSSATFLRYRDVAGLNAAMSRVTTERALPAGVFDVCAQGTPVSTTWVRGEDPTVLGRVLCYPDPAAGATMEFTEDRVLARGIIHRADNDFAALYNWWLANDFI